MEEMKKMKKCCVIGGDGFIGRYLSQALVASGREVLVLGRKATSDFQHEHVSYQSVDANDFGALKHILSTCDELVDLAFATVPKTSFSDPIFDLQSNLPRVVGLLELLKDLPNITKIIFTSSGGTVYGHAKQLPISENAETEPVSPYGITKLTIERYALMYHRLHNLPVVIVRPANAYGHGQQPFIGQGFIATAMGQILHGQEVTVFGQTGTIRDYIHVKDVARGFVAALDFGQNGDVLNVGSGVGLSNKDVLDLIRPMAQAAGYPLKVKHEAERKFDVSANVLNFGRLLSRSGWIPTIKMAQGLTEMWHGLALQALRDAQMQKNTNSTVNRVKE